MNDFFTTVDLIAEFIWNLNAIIFGLGLLCCVFLYLLTVLSGIKR